MPPQTPIKNFSHDVYYDHSTKSPPTSSIMTAAVESQGVISPTISSTSRALPFPSLHAPRLRLLLRPISSTRSPLSHGTIYGSSSNSWTSPSSSSTPSDNYTNMPNTTFSLPATCSPASWCTRASSKAARSRRSCSRSRWIPLCGACALFSRPTTRLSGPSSTTWDSPSRTFGVLLGP